jgi:hypothetical protein
MSSEGPTVAQRLAGGSPWEREGLGDAPAPRPWRTQPVRYGHDTLAILDATGRVLAFMHAPTARHVVAAVNAVEDNVAANEARLGLVRGDGHG